MKSVLVYTVYTLSSEAKAAHSSPPDRITLHILISVHTQKSSIPIKFPFPSSPMIFPPHTNYLAFVRVVKNKKIREKFSCLAIFLSVREVVRLSRNSRSQILNFFSCSDWFSRNYHAPATLPTGTVLIFLEFYISFFILYHSITYSCCY